ncbi:low affinity potassium transporter [Balamuthia mandrillaris]
MYAAGDTLEDGGQADDDPEDGLPGDTAADASYATAPDGEQAPEKPEPTDSTSAQKEILQNEPEEEKDTWWSVITNPTKWRAGTFVSYFRVHFLAFVLLSGFGAVLLVLLETGNMDLVFTDALFFSISAVTVTGLSTQDTASLRLASQMVIYALIFCGGAIMESMFPVLIRWWTMMRRARKTLKKAHLQRSFSLTSVLDETQNFRGRTEFRALLRLLVWIPAYFITLQLGTFVLLAIFAHFSPTYRKVLEDNDNNPWWWSIFHALSAFNNAGYSTMPDSLMKFNRSSFFLTTMAMVTLFGNMAYPVVLRLLLWLYYRFLLWKKTHRKNKNGPDHEREEVYHYLLSHPRRCTTHLFPSAHTRWLLAMLIALTLTEYVLFLALDWNSEAVDGMDAYDKLSNGFAQSVFARAAGFNCIDINLLNPGMQALYVGLMYVSAFPTIITLRHSAHLDSFSLENKDEEEKVQRSVVFQAKRLLLWDLFWVFLAWISICISESDRLNAINYDQNFTFMKILFEVTSAYGTVGMSLGYPGLLSSFSGALNTFSKWMIMFVMLMGRHRGLPDSVDKVVSLSPILLSGSEDSEDEADMEMGAEQHDHDRSTPHLH